MRLSAALAAFIAVPVLLLATADNGTMSTPSDPASSEVNR